MLYRVDNQPTRSVSVSPEGRFRFQVYHLVPKHRRQFIKGNTIVVPHLRTGSVALPWALWKDLSGPRKINRERPVKVRVGKDFPPDPRDYRADWVSHIESGYAGVLFLPNERLTVRLPRRLGIAPRYAGEGPIREGFVPEEAFLGKDDRVYLKYSDGRIALLSRKSWGVYAPASPLFADRLPPGAKKISMKEFKASAVIRLHYLAPFHAPDRNWRMYNPLHTEYVYALILDEKFFQSYALHMKKRVFANRPGYASWKKRLDRSRARKTAEIHTMEIFSHPGGRFFAGSLGKRALIAIAMPFAVIGDIITFPIQGCLAFQRGYVTSMLR